MDKINNDNIWRYQDSISRRLLRWAMGSILVGLLLRVGGVFWRKLGNQFIAWGSIDALIAIIGQVQKRNRIDTIANPGEQAVRHDEAKNLRRLLWINAVLDVFYMLGGLWWMRRNKDDAGAKGNGLGVIIQGAFLFFFDVFHALRLPDDEES